MFYKRISDLRPFGRPIDKRNWNNLVIDPIPESDDAPSALHAKSMWMAVAIAKDKNNRPTGNPKKIEKYETKRMNVYKFVQTFNNYIQSQESETSIVTAEILSADIVSSISGGMYLPGNKFTINRVSADSISSESIDISTQLNATSITALQINEINDAQIDHISGSTFNFSEISFDNLSSRDLSSYNLNAQNITTDEISAPSFLFNNVKLDTAAYKSVVIDGSIRSELGNITEMFRVPDNTNYDDGTVVRFGISSEANNNWEITEATAGAGNIANGIIGDPISSGIILNYKDNNLYKPVVLLGITKVKVYSLEINIGDKLYLSKSSNGRAGTEVNGKPIAIALQAKGTNPTKDIIKCFVKFNVE
jgi:hypothetical protein